MSAPVSPPVPSADPPPIPDDVAFDDVAAAFADRSDADLRRAWLLFSALDRPAVVAAGRLLARLSLSMHLPVGWIFRRTIYPQFVGGESLEACAATIERLAAAGLGVILDFARESLRSERDYDLVRDEVIRTIDLAAVTPNIPLAAFKMSALAREDLLERVTAGHRLSADEEAEMNRARARVSAICRRADEHGVPVMIDAERLRHQGAIDAVALEMMRAHNGKRIIVYTTAQLYLRGRDARVAELIEQGRREGFRPGFKLVRGAYMDEERAVAREADLPDPVHPTKDATDSAFDATVRYCLAAIDSCAICVGTHNKHSCERLTAEVDLRDIPRRDPRIWCSQLYGMSDDLSAAMARAGFNVAKYTPYGPVREVIPYLVRRAEENTAVTEGQSGRELALIRRERARRIAARS